MDAGKLSRRATFQRPQKDVDVDGQVVQSYPDVLSVWCQVVFLRGGESVMQARLASRSPAIVKVRKSPATAAVTSEWRIRIDGREFEVKEDPRETDDRVYFEMLVERVG